MVLVITLAACAYPSKDGEAVTPEEQTYALPDTKWELIEVSDSSGAASIPKRVDAGIYTVAINADGTVTFRLDCNRGFGKWRIAGDNSAMSGNISFFDIGVTKALCPPGSISDEVTSAISRFDAYQIADSLLSLSADNGAIVYRWTRIEANEEQVRD